MIRKVMGLIIIFVICFMEVGCMYTKEDYKKVMNDAVQYLTDKYGEEFILDSYEIGDILSDTDSIRCFTTDMDRENEYVEVVVNPDSPRGFSDNYFGYLIRPDMEEQIRNVLGVYDCKIYRENIKSCLPDGLERGCTIEDLYREMPNCWMSVNAYLPADYSMSDFDYQIMTEKLENWMIESGHYYTINLFVVNNEWYSRIDRYQQDDFWRYYADHDSPDHNNLYFVYSQVIAKGGVI